MSDTIITQTMTLADLTYRDGWARVDIGGVPHEVRAVAGVFDVRKPGGIAHTTMPLTVLSADVEVTVTQTFEGAEVQRG